MRIILVVTDTKRKSLFFVTDNLVVHTLKGAVALARENEIHDVYTMKRKQAHSYERSRLFRRVRS